MAGQYVANRPLQSTAGNTIAGVLEEPQDEEPLMTREGLLTSNRRQNLGRTFDRPRWTAPIFLFQSCLKSSGGEGHADAVDSLVLVPSIFSVYALLLAIVPA